MPSLEELLESSRRDLIAQLPQRLADINRLWNARALQDLYRTVHNLFGTSGVLELDDLSQAAQTLDGTLGPIVKNGGAPGAEQVKQIAEQISTLTQVAQKLVESRSKGEES